MSKRHVYHIDDFVRIVEPLVVQRVGYPFDQRAEAERIATQHGSQIASLIEEIDPEGGAAFVKRANDSMEDFLRLNPTAKEGDLLETKGLGDAVDYRDLCGRLARIIAQRHGFGGNRRSIHTERKPDYVGMRCRVEGKRVVRTGDRVPPSYFYDSYSGGQEYEPGYLNNIQSHVLLRVCPWYPHSTEFNVYDPFEIEATHVEPADRNEQGEIS